MREWLCAAGLVVVWCAPVAAQQPPLRVEHRASGSGAADAGVEADAGSSVTLVFRLTNASGTAHSVLTRLLLPDTWQALFASERIQVPANGTFADTITVTPPRDAAGGDYQVTYEARLSPDDVPITAHVTVHVAERRQLTLSWADQPVYIAAGAATDLELVVANRGNVAERVTLDVRSQLGVPVSVSWPGGDLPPGDARRVRVARLGDAPGVSARESLKASVRGRQMVAAVEASVSFQVVPEGRSTSAQRARMPVAVAARVGTRRTPGFGSVVGGGPLAPDSRTTVRFGFLAAEQSHPLMFERNRNYVNITRPGLNLAFGDQIWSLSPLTETGHYGLGAGGTFETKRVTGGAFVDAGRTDVVEGSQAGGFLGLGLGRGTTLSAQYLRRFSDTPASPTIGEMGSLRLSLKPLPSLSGSLEAAVGRSPSGNGYAGAGQLAFTSRRLTFVARRIRRDDAYPIRDRTGLLDNATLSLRPFGQLQIRGTLDGIAQVDDRSLPLGAPTRQRASRASINWGSLARVTVARTDWTSPGRDWDGSWRRESANAELRVPLGPFWISPGAEQGTQVTPTTAQTLYQLGWLSAGVRLFRAGTVTARGEYGRGVSGLPDQVTRRLSLNASLRPTRSTSATLQVQNSAIDALWLLGTRSIIGTLEQDLLWHHRLLLRYQSRTGGGFGLPDERAYRLDYVVPFAVPTRVANEGGRVTIRLRDGDTGAARPALLLQIANQSRLTDANGVATFTGLGAGDYDVTIGPSSIGPGRTVVPALPLRVSLTPGGHVDVQATIIRTARVAGRIQLFQSASLSTLASSMPLTPGAGVVGALLDLTVNGEHRTAVSDAQGRFNFDNVPPGTWPLRVTRASVPTFYQLETTDTMLAVSAGQTQDVVLRVVPKGGPQLDLVELAPVEIVQPVNQPVIQRAAQAPQPATAPVAPVAPAPAPVPAPAISREGVRNAAADLSGYVVQVAALRSEADADAMRARLAKKGYPAFVMPYRDVFRVRVGMYPARATALAISRRLKAEERLAPWVTR